MQLPSSFSKILCYKLVDISGKRGERGEGRERGVVDVNINIEGRELVAMKPRIVRSQPDRQAVTTNWRGVRYDMTLENNTPWVENKVKKNSTKRKLFSKYLRRYNNGSLVPSDDRRHNIIIIIIII